MVIYNLVRELKRILDALIENKCIKVFVATRKTLLIFVDGVLERDSVVKNMAEVLSEHDAQCEFKMLPMLNNQKSRDIGQAAFPEF